MSKFIWLPVMERQIVWASIYEQYQFLLQMYKSFKDAFEKMKCLPREYVYLIRLKCSIARALCCMHLFVLTLECNHDLELFQFLQVLPTFHSTFVKALGRETGNSKRV